MFRNVRILGLVLVCLSGFLRTAPADTRMGNVGTFAKWARIEISLEGPAADGNAGMPNPFLIETEVRFQSPRGKMYTVPAYFDGDGKGGAKGNVWKVRFSADETGQWRFSSMSAENQLHKCSGIFDVTAPAADAPVLYRYGRLQYDDYPYLKFAEGPFWLKGGTDSPENFLGKAMGDWARKKAEVNYLAGQGVNCVYIMTNNTNGDGRDVWPWVGATETEAKTNHRRFDVAKLRLWQDFFEHIQSRGIVIQIVLNDDSAWLGYNHRMYLREMVARFGYLPAIYWNVGEEYNEAFKSFAAAQRYAATLAQFDPYKHPIAVHNVNEPSEAMIRDSNITVTSIQTDPVSVYEINAIALRWRRTWRTLLRPMVVSFDEGRPPMDRGSVWAAYMGGAMWEALDTELEKGADASFRKNETFWREMTIARKFVEALPFWDMEPSNTAVEGGFCLARKDVVYAIYSPVSVPVTLKFGDVEGTFEVRWYHPTKGEYVQGEVKTVEGGRRVSIGKAPFDGDAAVVIRRKQ